VPDSRLRIELLDTDPLVWRRVVVPEQINLHRFHELIQDVMGWGDCHLYEFECNGRYYGEPDEWSDRSIALARNAKLKALAARPARPGRSPSTWKPRSRPRAFTASRS